MTIPVSLVSMPMRYLIAIFQNIGLICHKILLGWFIRGEILNFSVYTHL
jgi:hypothetical protein